MWVVNLSLTIWHWVTAIGQCGGSYRIIGLQQLISGVEIMRKSLVDLPILFPGKNLIDPKPSLRPLSPFWPINVALVDEDFGSWTGFKCVISGEMDRVTCFMEFTHPLLGICDLISWPMDDPHVFLTQASLWVEPSERQRDLLETYSEFSPPSHLHFSLCYRTL